MPRRHSSIRARATSILATIHQGQLHDPGKTDSDRSQQATLNEKQDTLERLRSSSSGAQTLSSRSNPSDAAAQNREAQRPVRTVPSWVRRPEDIDESYPSPPVSPSSAFVAQHHHSPSQQRQSHTSPTRSDIQEEEWVPPWPGATLADTSSRWLGFKTATEYPHETSTGGQMVDEKWWRDNGPNYDEPWLAGQHDADSEEGAMMYKHGIRRKAWYQRFQSKILRSPIVPMAIRMIVLSFSVVALGLAASIHHITDDSVVAQSPSTDMAIIVDAVAIVYLMYITYDEYSGKPLGLRSARAKMRLIFLDLFFIVFNSANLSLAFVTTRITSCDLDEPERPCTQAETDVFNEVLYRQRSLASVLLIVLISWLATFAISITR